VKVLYFCSETQQKLIELKMKKEKKGLNEVLKKSVFRRASDLSSHISGNSVADGFAFDGCVFGHKGFVLVKVVRKGVAVCV